MSNRLNPIYVYTDVRDQLHHELLNNYIIQGCTNCEHFRALDGEVCALAQQRPPVKVLVYGCKEWLPDIPF
jgi:hypothetical protein